MKLAALAALPGASRTQAVRRWAGLRGRYLAQVLALAITYDVAAQVGFAFEFAGPVAAIVWLPVGVAISFLYLGGVGLWPGVLVGDLLVNDYRRRVRSGERRAASAASTRARAGRVLVTTPPWTPRGGRASPMAGDDRLSDHSGQKAGTAGSPMAGDLGSPARGRRWLLSMRDHLVRLRGMTEAARSAAIIVLAGTVLAAAG
ncbi:MAG: hypothetical protein ACXVVU_16070, partial [Solirubrobacteraceae bacterium]